MFAAPQTESGIPVLVAMSSSEWSNGTFGSRVKMDGSGFHVGPLAPSSGSGQGFRTGSGLGFRLSHIIQCVLRSDVNPCPKSETFTMETGFVSCTLVSRTKRHRAKWEAPSFSE